MAIVVSPQVSLRASGQFGQPDRVKKEAALRRLSLPEAARIAGGVYSRVFNVHSWAIAPTLEALGESSELIVVGKVTGVSTILSSDQTYILSVVTLHVGETIKGRPGAGEFVSVVVPGGRMVFEDGTAAETATPGLEPFAVGEGYALFLTRIERLRPQDVLEPEARGSYAPTLGPQGIIALKPTGVRPQGREVDAIRSKHSNQPPGVFMSELRRLRR
jgi:hypothetical protein